jgi:flagellar hook-associated protein FlgK
MASLFDIGINGLRAQQAALNVVGQNITNASTPGYTRQRAVQSSIRLFALRIFLLINRFARILR